MITDRPCDVSFLVCKTGRCSDRQEDIVLANVLLLQKPHNRTLLDGLTVKVVASLSDFKKGLHNCAAGSAKWT